MTKLGVNIDHIATLRQARLETFPSPLALALEAVRGGATGITAHLREDRRHIQEFDIVELKKKLPVPLNMEMAVAPGILRVALRVKPAWACLVPEKRKELTTEGGLNLGLNRSRLKAAIQTLQKDGIFVSLFIDPNLETVKSAHQLGADAVEFHTGSFARTWPTPTSRRELKKIRQAAVVARQLGLSVNAGHGINYENVKDLTKAFDFDEFNIGFAIVARAVEVGMRQAVREMKKKMGS